MFEVLHDVIGQVRQLLAEFEPDRFDGAGARSLVEAFGELERLGAAGKSLAPRQVVATGSWKQGGAHRDAADWLAATTGATVGAARATLDTSSRLASLPSTEAALRAGVLSAAQVDAIADAASLDPGASRPVGTVGARRRARAAQRVRSGEGGGMRRRERALRAGARGAVAAVVDRCRRCRADRHPRPGRRHRRGARRPGAVRAELFEQARVEGRRERHDALAFDAMVALAGA